MRLYFSPVEIVITGEEQLMRAACIKSLLANEGTGGSKHQGLFVFQQWDGKFWRQIPLDTTTLEWLETKLDGCLYGTWYYIVAPFGLLVLLDGIPRPAAVRLGLEGLVKTNGPKRERPGARRADGRDPYLKETEL